MGALTAFRELHGRALFLAQRRYEDCGILRERKPEGGVSYLHHKQIPFPKMVETDDTEGLPFSEVYSKYFRAGKGPATASAKQVSMVELDAPREESLPTAVKN